MVSYILTFLDGKELTSSLILQLWIGTVSVQSRNCTIMLNISTCAYIPCAVKLQKAYAPCGNGLQFALLEKASFAAVIVPGVEEGQTGDRAAAVAAYPFAFPAQLTRIAVRVNSARQEVWRVAHGFAVLMLAQRS